MLQMACVLLAPRLYREVVDSVVRELCKAVLLSHICTCLQRQLDGGISIMLVAVLTGCPAACRGSVHVRHRGCAAGAEGAMERESRPKNSETFWKGMQVDLGEGRTMSASVWPKV